MSEYTKGPWKVDVELGSSSGEYLIAFDAGSKGRGIAIAETRPATGNERWNARLIAAAPDLLEALKKIERRLEAGDLDEWSIRALAHAARITIEKAEGEQP